jgi:AcrR family transcriptional regulator
VPDVTDQRVLRGRRNRAAIVDAMLTLVKEGNLTPTADQIATEAGVARRSVYHHFDDLDDLMRAAADREVARHLSLLKPLPNTGPFEDRCTAFVEQRCGLSEGLLSVYRSARLAALHSDVVAEHLAATDEFFRAELQQTFRPELRRAPSWMLETLDLVTSLDGWVRLRVNQRLSPRRARNVVEATLTCALAPDPQR